MSESQNIIAVLTPLEKSVLLMSLNPEWEIDINTESGLVLVDVFWKDTGMPVTWLADFENMYSVENGLPYRMAVTWELLRVALKGDLFVPLTDWLRTRLTVVLDDTDQVVERWWLLFNMDAVKFNNHILDTILEMALSMDVLSLEQQVLQMMKHPVFGAAGLQSLRGSNVPETE